METSLIQFVPVAGVEKGENMRKVGGLVPTRDTSWCCMRRKIDRFMIACITSERLTSNDSTSDAGARGIPSGLAQSWSNSFKFYVVGTRNAKCTQN